MGAQSLTSSGLFPFTDSSVQMPPATAMMLAMSDETLPNGSTLMPSLRYRDAKAAVEWLEHAFGFARHSYYSGPDDTVAHAELRHGHGMIMIGSSTSPGPQTHLYATPAEISGRVTSPLYLIVENCDTTWESAKAAGAEVVMELKAMDYGGRAFTVRDPEGYLWSVGEYNPWTAREAATGAETASK